MIKRLLASFMSILMIMTVFVAVPVSATSGLPANIGTDYVPGTVTGNIITAGAAGAVGAGGDYTYTVNNHNGGLQTYAASGQAVYFKSKSAGVSDPTVSSSTGANVYQHPVVGFDVKTSAPADATGRVVFSFNVRNTASTAVVNLGRRNTSYTDDTNSLRLEYPVEYNGATQGFAPTSGYATYTGSFADTGATSDKYEYAFGFAGGTGGGAITWFIVADSYIGYEYAYDMKLTAADTTIEPGTSITLDADVVNQIGSKGALSQEITWYALNADRTAVVPGINISEGADGTVTITAANSVSTDTYCIVAVSDAHPELVKGVEIAIEAIDFNDYTPDTVITGNLLGGALTLTYNYNQHNTYIEGSTANKEQYPYGGSGDAPYRLKADRRVIDPHIVLADTNADGFGDTWDGTTYKYTHALTGAYIGPFSLGSAAGTRGNIVFSFKMNTVDSSALPKVNVGRVTTDTSDDTSAASVEYPVEYNSKTSGFTPETTGTSTWNTTFKGTILDNGKAIDAYTYEIGLVEGTPANGAVYISKDAYIGLEYAHDIEIKSMNGNTLSVETPEIDLEYGLLNQVGSAYCGSEDIEFLIMTPDRQTELTDTGITITDNGDGTAKATLDPFTATAGTYDIVAYSTANNMAKGITVTVEESDLVSELTLSDFSGSSVTATAKLLNRTNTPINGVLVVIMVNDKNQITDFATASITDLTSTDGISTYTKTLTATDLTKVVKAKAFVLDCGDAAAPSLYNSTLKQLAPSVTKTK